MANNQKNINIFFTRFNNQFAQVIPNIIAETAIEFVQERFKQQNWDNVPWQPLNPTYATKKRRGKGRILTRSGILFRSISAPVVTAKKITISAGNSRTPYARAHNEGLRISGIQQIGSYINTNFMGKGKRVQIKAHSRKVDFKMPKRQYMGNSVYLNRAIKDRLTAAWNASK